MAKKTKSQGIKRKRTIFQIIAFFVAVICAVALFLGLQQIRQETKYVLVSSKSLEVGDIVNESNTTLKEFLSENVNENAITDIEMIKGKEVVVKLEEGSVFLPHLVDDKYVGVDPINLNKVGIEIKNPSHFLANRLVEETEYMLIAYTSSGEVYNKYLAKFLYSTEDSGDKTSSLPSTMIFATENEEMAVEISLISAVHNIAIVQPSDEMKSTYEYASRTKEYKFEEEETEIIIVEEEVINSNKIQEKDSENTDSTIGETNDIEKKTEDAEEEKKDEKENE